MRTSCIIALAAARVPRIFPVLNSWAPFSRIPATYSESQSFSPITRVLVTEGKASPAFRRIPRGLPEIYTNQDTPAWLREPCISEDISQVLRRSTLECVGGGERRGIFFLVMEVGKRTPRLDPLSGCSSAERSVRLAIRIFWRTRRARAGVHKNP